MKVKKYPFGYRVSPDLIYQWTADEYRTILTFPHLPPMVAFLHGSRKKPVALEWRASSWSITFVIGLGES